MKAFQLKCRKCGKVLSSVSWRGAIAALRRHAVKHPQKDFPLKYLWCRVSGRAVRFRKAGGQK
jgi:autonomous glycyl radical cofactor GrcA